MQAQPWPIEEAKKLLPKVQSGKTIIFETGYGPSGLPHIGTFGEVARTMMVIRALHLLEPKVCTKLISFSDDLDGLRKIPDNIPNRETLKQYLGRPLTNIPDPFGTHESYGAHMNAALREFLDLFGFNYDFKSSTECYKAGVFNKHLLLILEHYEEVMKIMLPTLGEERQATYSPFLPICKRTGKVLQVKIEQINKSAGTIIYKDEETNQLIETSVINGSSKLQWKPDWGMRWAALGIDYELHGKDIQPSALLSTKICKLINNNEAPQLCMYELFLDEEGRKISKSKGNGLTIEEWLKYAPPESLSFFMFQNPHRAKRLYFDIIPRNVDDYIKFSLEAPQENLDNPIYNPVIFLHDKVPKIDMQGISFSLLLNLAAACNAENSEILWGFIRKHNPNITQENNNFLAQLIEYAVNYYNDFIKPNKKYKIPNFSEKQALLSLINALEENRELSDPTLLQQLVYNTGNSNGYKENIKDWFQMLYQVLLGQEQGPRLGSFFALYGIGNSIALIKETLQKEAA